MEVHAPEMAGGVVAFIVPLACLTGFAIREEGLIGRSVDGDPDFARLPVNAVCMAS
jgi:hypothetical protein